MSCVDAIQLVESDRVGANFLYHRRHHFDIIRHRSDVLSETTYVIRHYPETAGSLLVIGLAIGFLILVPFIPFVPPPWVLGRIVRSPVASSAGRDNERERHKSQDKYDHIDALFMTYGITWSNQGFVQDSD